MTRPWVRWWQAVRHGRRSGQIVAGAAICATIAAAWIVRAAARDVRPVSFVSYGAALLLEDSDVWSVPAGGRSLGRVAAGTRLGVGGRAAVHAGQWRVDALWIALNTAGGALQGFVPASAAIIVAGTAPRLDLSGIDPRMLAHRRVAGGGTIPWLPEPVEQWRPLFDDAGARHGVDPDLLAIVALVESGGRPDVSSPAGAIGLMQIMPGTAADIARWRGLDVDLPDDLLDPALNVDFGAYYVARMLQQFSANGSAKDTDNAVARAAVAYNGGPGTAALWLAGGDLPAETSAYQGYIVGMWRERTLSHSTTFERWCRAGGGRLVPGSQCPSG